MNELTVEQASIILGVSRQTVYTRLGLLPKGSNPGDVVEAELDKLNRSIKKIERNLELVSRVNPTVNGAASPPG